MKNIFHCSSSLGLWLDYPASHFSQEGVQGKRKSKAYDEILPTLKRKVQKQLATFFLNNSNLYKVWHFRKSKGLILTQLNPKYSIWLNTQQTCLEFNDPRREMKSPKKLEPLPCLKTFFPFWFFRVSFACPRTALSSLQMYSHNLGPERYIKTRENFNPLKWLLWKEIYLRNQESVYKRMSFPGTLYFICFEKQEPFY